MTLHGVPRLPRGLVARSRLDAIWESASPFVVVQARAGFGKTTALAQWATATPRTGVWLTLRDGIESSAALVLQVAEAMLDADPTEFANIQAALRGIDQPWDALRSLLRERGPEYTIVLDNAQLLTAEAVQDLIGEVQRHDGMAVRAAVRHDGPLTDSALTLGIDAMFVSERDVALTAEEAADLLGDRADLVEQVMGSGGAPAIARLVTLGLERESNRTWGVAEAADTYLRSALNGWDAAAIAVLTRAAASDSVDISFADQHEHAQALARAERAGMGAWHHSASGSPTEFVFAGFVREALERRLRADLSAAELRPVMIDAARRQLSLGRPFPALRRAVEFSDWDLAEEVIRAHWYDLFAFSKPVRSLFRRVPLSTLRRRPVIAMFLAVLHNAHRAERVRAVELFTLATIGVRRNRPAKAADRFLLGSVEAIAHRISGRSQAMTTAARRAFDIATTMNPDERSELGRTEATLWTHLGTSLLYSDEQDAALQCFQAAADLLDGRGHQAGLMGLALSAGTLALRGDVRRGVELTDEARARIWPDRWLDGYHGSFLHVADAVVALEDDRPGDALARIAVLAPHRPTIEHWAVLTHLEALADLLRHEPEHARFRLESAWREHAPRRAVLRSSASLLHRTMALVDIARGDHRAAQRSLERDPLASRDVTARARLDLARGHAPNALRLLAARNEIPSPRLRAEHLALLAAALAMDGASAEQINPVLARLEVDLHGHGLKMPLRLVPEGGLDALAAATRHVDISPAIDDRLAEARGARVLPAAAPVPRLTARERAVADELMQTSQAAEIAGRLGVSVNTVKSQRRSLYRKLGVGSHAEAVRVLAAMDLTALVPEADGDD